MAAYCACSSQPVLMVFTTLTSGYFAIASRAPFSRSWDQEAAASPVMMRILPLAPMYSFRMSEAARPDCTRSCP